MSDSLGPYEPQHARPPCPSPTPGGVHPISCPLSQWCHPTIFILCRPLLLLPSIFPVIWPKISWYLQTPTSSYYSTSTLAANPVGSQNSKNYPKPNCFSPLTPSAHDPAHLHPWDVTAASSLVPLLPQVATQKPRWSDENITWAGLACLRKVSRPLLSPLPTVLFTLCFSQSGFQSQQTMLIAPVSSLILPGELCISGVGCAPTFPRRVHWSSQAALMVQVSELTFPWMC